jgi:hypothetical protein
LWIFGYVTPHDPLTEVRHGEFFKFKEIVLEIDSKDGREMAEKFIYENKHLYAEKRSVSTVFQWAKSQRNQKRK